MKMAVKSAGVPAVPSVEGAPVKLRTRARVRRGCKALMFSWFDISWAPSGPSSGAERKSPRRPGPIKLEPGGPVGCGVRSSPSVFCTHELLLMSWRQRELVVRRAEGHPELMARMNIIAVN